MTFGIVEMAKYLFNHRNGNWFQIPFNEYREIPKMLCDSMAIFLLKGEKIRLERIGIIETKVIKGKICRNPKTGETFPRPDRIGIRFKTSKYLSELLNSKNKKCRRTRKFFH